MSVNRYEKERKALVVLQQLLSDERDQSEITPTVIREKLKLVISIHATWKDIDVNWVVGESIRRNSIWSSPDLTLSNEEGHVRWLNSDRKTDWRYWSRYSDWIEEKLPAAAIENLDESTDEILGLLEDPNRSGAWDRRGLIVGHVQSGKTGNYTGLICKAADAGYKIIIVLAGLHNNLRTQTQIRLDEGFLGYTTAARPQDLKLVGVGALDNDPAIRPNYATNQQRDFNERAAQVGITSRDMPLLFVVKKNKSILANLLNWLTNNYADRYDHDRKQRIINKQALLLIDDEADHASVDTRENTCRADGELNEEHKPTAINHGIRKILNLFSKKAYVGYTATPFANIFIHNRATTTELGDDLFPKAFISNLSAPSNYIGPAKMFGVADVEGRTGGLPLLRTIPDDDFRIQDYPKTGWMPHKHKSTHVPVCDNTHGMPDSLINALNSFLIGCAIRKLRGDGAEHISMLIHVTRFVLVQDKVHGLVHQYIRLVKQQLTRKIGDEIILEQLENLWLSDFIDTTHAIVSANLEEKYLEISWHDLLESLRSVVLDIDVRQINGSAKDALDYEESPIGLKVIAIGGDKLSRGLTLEGLTVSYFLRASRMYDTLMQMGRWFGYRKGYLDICRLYTTAELIDWFKLITDASEELREEFDVMVDTGGTPEDFGLKVASHPSLLITSQVKMRTSQTLYLSYSGNVVQTVSFFKDEDTITHNLSTFNSLVSSLGTANPIPTKIRPGVGAQNWSGVCWEKTSYINVVNFLKSYKTPAAASKVNSDFIADFIDNMAQRNFLTEWFIAIVGGGVSDPESLHTVSGTSIARAQRGMKVKADRYSIGTLVQSKDEGMDLGEEMWLAALEDTKRVWNADPARKLDTKMPTEPSRLSLRRIRGLGNASIKAIPERGLLIIYLLDRKTSLKDDMTAGPISSKADPVVSFACSFPENENSHKFKYEANNVFWENEYGSSE